MYGRTPVRPLFIVLNLFQGLVVLKLKTRNIE